MKILCCFLLFSQSLFAQKIIISGKEGNRPLVWEDFKGNPDDSSTYFATTYWNINYKYSDVQIKNGQVNIGKFEVLLELNPTKSWLKKNKGSIELLKHEQGHFNTGILCMNEIIKRELETVFTAANYSVQISTIFKETLKKYHALDDKYDTETAHSSIIEQQLKWNQFYEAELSKNKKNILKE